MLRIQIFTFNPFQENTYVVYDETKECVIIDPGCIDRYEEEELKDFILNNTLQVKKLLNTHCHVDHVLGNYFVKKEFNVKLYLHEIEEPYLRAVKTYAPNYGFFNYQETTPDEYLDENSKVTFGNTSFDVLFVPGHSAGHIAFYDRQSGHCFAGDVLFRESIGRTDLPGGDYDTLIQSIRQKMFALPDETIVFPGHGPETTIRHEKKYNPFCAVE